MNKIPCFVTALFLGLATTTILAQQIEINYRTFSQEEEVAFKDIDRKEKNAVSNKKIKHSFIGKYPVLDCEKGCLELQVHLKKGISAVVAPYFFSESDAQVTLEDLGDEVLRWSGNFIATKGESILTLDTLATGIWQLRHHYTVQGGAAGASGHNTNKNAVWWNSKGQFITLFDLCAYTELEQMRVLALKQVKAALNFDNGNGTRTKAFEMKDEDLRLSPNYWIENGFLYLYYSHGSLAAPIYGEVQVIFSAKELEKILPKDHRILKMISK